MNLIKKLMIWAMPELEHFDDHPNRIVLDDDAWDKLADILEEPVDIPVEVPVEEHFKVGDQVKVSEIHAMVVTELDDDKVLVRVHNGALAVSDKIKVRRV